MLSCGNLQVALKMFLSGLQSSCPCHESSRWLLPGVSAHTRTVAKQLQVVGKGSKGLGLRQEAAMAVLSLKTTLLG